MKTATFDNTVSILVQAYFNNRLVHGVCNACAVGNLVGAALNDFDFIVESSSFGGVGKGWAAVFCSQSKMKQVKNPSQYKDEAKRQIDATGYTWQQLAMIEMAFESQSDDNLDDDVAMFNGLMAVVSVLAEIHNVSLEAKEEAKKMFVKI